MILQQVSKSYFYVMLNYCNTQFMQTVAFLDVDSVFAYMKSITVPSCIVADVTYWYILSVFLVITEYV